MTYKVRLICLKCSPILIFLLFFQPVFSQYDFGQVDQMLQQNQKALGKEFVALVWKDGKLIYQKEMGDFNAKTPAPIASCSKWLTAALVMTFVDEGKISLDDKVTKYLPIFGKYMKGYITIRNCLSHTTGVQAESGSLMRIVSRKKFETLEEEVNYFATKREITSNPGTEFFYSNVGMDIAGRVLEVVSRKTFDRLMLERIFRPLKMKNSSFSVYDNSAVNPSGGAQSSANDYLNFLIMILNKGMFNGKRILSEKAIAEMGKAQFPDLPVKYTPKVAEGYHYGLGEWILESDSKGNTTVMSSPGLFGTWPYVDLCRDYAAIFFVKSLLNEEKKELYLQFKESIDGQIPKKCE